MKPYVSAMGLINMADKLGHAILHCEHDINDLKLRTGNYDFETVWQDLLDIHFWDSDEQEYEACKLLCKSLMAVACAANEETLEVTSSNKSSAEQSEFYYE